MTMTLQVSNATVHHSVVASSPQHAYVQVGWVCRNASSHMTVDIVVLHSVTMYKLVCCNDRAQCMRLFFFQFGISQHRLCSLSSLAPFIFVPPVPIPCRSYLLYSSFFSDRCSRPT